MYVITVFFHRLKQRFDAKVFFSDDFNGSLDLARQAAEKWRDKNVPDGQVDVRLLPGI